MIKRKVFAAGILIYGALCISFFGGCRSRPVDSVGSPTEQPTVKELGYIYNFNPDKRSFDFDEIEWITLEDDKRIEELGIEDMPGGFYIYNPDTETVRYTFDDKTTFLMIDWETVGHIAADLDEFADNREIYPEYLPPYRITAVNGTVVEIAEQYVP